MTTATEVNHAQQGLQHALMGALTSAMKAQKLNAKAFKQARSGVPSAVWIREFCTIRLQVGRRVGSTTLMTAIAQAPLGDAIVARDWKLILDVHRGCGASISSLEQFLRNVDRNRFGTVYVDEPSLTLPRSQDQYEFYDALGRAKWHGDPLVIMLGA